MPYYGDTGLNHFLNREDNSKTKTYEFEHICTFNFYIP